MPNGLYESDIEDIWSKIKENDRNGWRSFFEAIS